MNDLVSVIIPVFNGEKYLQQCLDSVTQQTYPLIEIIVVNDGSTDSTSAILQSIDDDRLVVLNTQQKGACYARNLGFEHSKGQYIQFLDADDFISRNKVEEQINILADTPQHLGICDTVIVDENSNSLGELPEQHKWLKNSDNSFEFLMELYKNYGMVQTNVWLTPRSIILKAGKWNESLKQDQDGEFFCRVVLASAGVRHASHCYNYYRKAKEQSLSISNKKGVDYAKSTITALDLKTKYILNRNKSGPIKKIMAMHYKTLAVRYFGVHADLYQDALNKCEQLGGTDYMPTLGGSTIEFLKRLLGWRLAKKILLLKQRF